jgi:hypothetical protein
VLGVFDGEFGDGDAQVAAGGAGSADGDGGDAGIGEVGIGEIGDGFEGAKVGVVREVDAEAGRKAVGGAFDGLPIDLGGDEGDPIEGADGLEIDLDPGGDEGRCVAARMLVAEADGGLADDGDAEVGELLFDGGALGIDGAQLRAEEAQPAGIGGGGGCR